MPSGTNGAASWNQRKPNTAWMSTGASSPALRDELARISARDTETDSPTVLDPVVVQRWVDDPATNHGFALEVTFRLP